MKFTVINFIYIFFLGFMAGGMVTREYFDYKSDQQIKVIKYKVGDCLSNGLFPEKVEEIRSNRTSSSGYAYVTTGYFAKDDGTIRKSALPDTVDTWIADQRYTKIDSKYCETTP
jgi:hypothetical protein